MSSTIPFLLSCQFSSFFFYIHVIPHKHTAYSSSLLTSYMLKKLYACILGSISKCQTIQGDKNVQKSCMQRRTTENNYFKLYCIGLLDVCNLKFIYLQRNYLNLLFQVMFNSSCPKSLLHLIVLNCTEINGQLLKNLLPLISTAGKKKTRKDSGFLYCQQSKLESC